MEIGTEAPTPMRSASEKLMITKGMARLIAAKAIGADELSHKDAVQGVVKAGSEHTEGAGNGGEEKEPHRWCL